MVDICRGKKKVKLKLKVHTQQVAPIRVLVGTDVLSKLGFVFLEPGPDDIATDWLSKQSGRREN